VPPNYALTSLGSEGSFKLAGSCPVAAQGASGEYMPHQGDAGSFLVADAQTRDGTASVRLALWRCVHCGLLLTGVARAEGGPGAAQSFTWLEEPAVLLHAGAPSDSSSAGREG